MVAVAEDNEGIYGIIIGILGEHPFLNEVYATELAWYLEEGRRGGTAAIKLLKTFVDWSKYKGATQIVMGDIVPLLDNKDLYERLGFTLVERSYYMESK